MTVMPIRAPPAITPAQTGSRFWTKTRLRTVVWSLHLRPASQNRKEPRNIAKQVWKGITKASPIPTPDTQKRPLRRDPREFQQDPEDRPDEGRELGGDRQFADALGEQPGHGLPDRGGRHGYCSLMSPCGLPFRNTR